MKSLRILAVIALWGLFIFLLTGCVTDGLSPRQIKPICAALVGPIKYNTFDAKSRRYAADLLAMDIHQRNSIGRQLRCPQYKVNAIGNLSWPQ